MALDHKQAFIGNALDSHRKSYSAKQAAAGKDIGKPGKNFAKIAAKEGGGENGNRIAGAILKKLRARHAG